MTYIQFSKKEYILVAENYADIKKEIILYGRPFIILMHEINDELIETIVNVSKLLTIREWKNLNDHIRTNKTGKQARSSDKRNRRTCVKAT